MIRSASRSTSRVAAIRSTLRRGECVEKVPSFTERTFVNMDTLFQHVDAHLFASLVELKDFGEHDFLDGRTYEEIYRQVRECVDLCHRDGVIKDEVARDPGRYLVLDDGLLPMLRGFCDAGIKVFLLTNCECVRPRPLFSHGSVLKHAMTSLLGAHVHGEELFVP